MRQDNQDRYQLPLRASDPLLHPLRMGQQIFPGIWREMMPPGLTQLRFPTERQAQCQRCPKSCYEDWRPDYRCCTYHPRISNFLLGLACQTAEGARAVDRLIQRGMLLPEGMHSSPRQWLDFVDDQHHDQFGKSQKVLCPMLDADSGLCQVHAFRNSVCSTYFCEHDQGQAGSLFWTQIQTLGTQLEMRLSQWALREVGFDLDASLEALNRLAPEMENLSSDEGWHPDVLRQIWGDHWGREKELLQACAAAVVQHRDQLWALAQGQRIAEAHAFDAALGHCVPEEQQDEDEESEWEEVTDLHALWQDCLVAHDALWEEPRGAFHLSPNVSFVPNRRESAEERHHQDQDVFLEYRLPNPERSLYFRLPISYAQQELLESLRDQAHTLAELAPESQEFLKEMVHRRVLWRKSHPS